MTRFVGLLVGLMAVAPAVAGAQPVSGLYVAGSAGMNFPRSPTMTTESAPPKPAQTEAAPLPNIGVGGAVGVGGVGGVGYGFGNGWRMEVEGSRRR